jgi:hypothetical protein
MAKKKRYVVPILKPEHCTREYMDSVGLPCSHAPGCYRWEDFVFGWDSIEDSCFRIESGFLDAETPTQNADAFNRFILATDPSAKPTGKPYPMPKRKAK